MTPAATLLLVRDRADGPEVLMIKRAEHLFGGGWWVFPGGSIEPQDEDASHRALLKGLGDRDDAPWVLAALRETVEEVGLVVGSGSGTKIDRADVLGSMKQSNRAFDVTGVEAVSQWRPPVVISRRFDTRFYVTEWTGTDEPAGDPAEVAAIEWIRASDALARSAERFPVVLPTRYHLELLARFNSAAAFVTYAASVEVVPIEPEPTVIDGVTHLRYTDSDGVARVSAMMNS